jgi:hypothetical protein
MSVTNSLAPVSVSKQPNIATQERPSEMASFAKTGAFIGGLIASGSIAIGAADYLLGKSEFSLTGVDAGYLLATCALSALSIGLKNKQEPKEEKPSLAGRITTTVSAIGVTLGMSGLVLSASAMTAMVVNGFQSLAGRCMETRQIDGNKPFDLDVCQLTFNRATSVALGSVLLFASATAILGAVSLVNRARKLDNVKAAPAA